MSALFHFLSTHPVVALFAAGLVVALAASLVKKLFKLAFALAVIIVALAIVGHVLGVDTLPEPGKRLMRKAGEAVEQQL